MLGSALNQDPDWYFGVIRFILGFGMGWGFQFGFKAVRVSRAHDKKVAETRAILESLDHEGKKGL